MSAPFPNQVEILKMNVEQTRTLASAPCSDAFASLSPTEPRSAREVAMDVGRSASSVTEQIAKLLDVGLIIPAGTRKRRSRTEQLYVHAGLITRFVLGEQDEASLKEYAHRFRTLMRLSERQFEAIMPVLANDLTFADFLGHKWHTAYVDRQSALRLKLALSELSELIGQLHEPNPEVREKGDYVRVHLTAMMLPDIAEAKKRTPKG